MDADNCIDSVEAAVGEYVECATRYSFFSGLEEQPDWPRQVVAVM
jgi:hypothetical protein